MCHPSTQSHEIIAGMKCNCIPHPGLLGFIKQTLSENIGHKSTLGHVLQTVAVEIF